jgi:hypothetical protein
MDTYQILLNVHHMTYPNGTTYPYTYQILLNVHSIFRYFVLAGVLAALIKAFIGWIGQRPFNRRSSLFAMIAMHIQFTLGILLYFFSPLVMMSDMAATMKNDISRYWTVEHAVMMLVAIALVTIGYVRSKKIADAVGKHRTIAIFYGLALLVVIFAIIQSGRPIVEFKVYSW